MLRLLGSAFSAALGLAVMTLLARWASAQAPFARLDSWGLLQKLRATLDPLLVAAGQRVGLSAPPETWNLTAMSLELAGVLFVLLLAQRAAFEALVDSLHHARARPAARPAGSPAPAAAPSAPAASPLATNSDATIVNPDVQATGFRPQGARAGELSARPERIGRYEILDELGRGAMGVVYKARDSQLGRIVAVKAILVLEGQDTAASNYRQRFFVEARSAGVLNHPGIVAVYDVSPESTSDPFLVLEFVEGTTLDKRVARQKYKFAEVLDLGAQVARALDFAHCRGVVHRDIKPPNIMVTTDGNPKVSDFGIAKLEGLDLTQTGVIVGTPAYMSPEQFTGAPTDRRTDIFSLGAVLYWLATGQRPFGGDTVATITYKLVNVDHTPPSTLNPALPVEFDRILTRCLAKPVAHRYATAAELAADLEALRKTLA